jgi:hypothetical protein
MNFRPSMIRAAAFALLLTTTAASSFAGDSRRRSVTPNPGGNATAPGYVWLEGIIMDADWNTPVARAAIHEGHRSGFTDAQGKFYIRLTPGTEFTIVLSRIGYETREQTVKISEDTLQTFRLSSLATTTIRTKGGVTYNVDTASMEFGYIAPFSEYNKSTHLNLCTSDAGSYQPERGDIKRLTPGAQLRDATCCPGASLPTINVELKSGGTVTGALADSCVGYTVDIIALDHVTALPVYLHLSDISEVINP